MSAQKVAIVTGAGMAADLTAEEASIGMAIARRFARDGYRVVVADVADGAVARSQAWLVAQGASCLAVPCDISQPSSCDDLLRQCVERFGRVDVVVNNAATGWQYVGRLLDLPPAAFDANLGVNLLGTLNMSRAAVSQLRQSRGAIINISSIAAQVLQMWPDLAAYNLAKAAINTATKQLAVDLASSGVRVNAILPGIIDTPSNRRHLQETLGEGAAAFWEQRAQVVPMRSIGTVDDVAAMCAFLASADARYVTGQLIAVDGGLSC